VLQREADADWDFPNVFFLRGLRLTRDIDDPSQPAGPQGTSITVRIAGYESSPYDVAVMYTPLGIGPNRRDREIALTANEYGVPPAYLKAQVEFEGGFRPPYYRYEPITWDLYYLTGDRSLHVVDSGVRILANDTFRPYVIAGPYAEGPTVREETLSGVGSSEFALTQVPAGHQVAVRLGMPPPSFSTPWALSATRKLGSTATPMTLVPVGTVWRVGKQQAGWQGECQSFKMPDREDAKVFTFVPPRTIRLSKPLGEGELLTITYNTVWTEQVLTWARRSRTPTGRL
jgi:hypothetical protein